MAVSLVSAVSPKPATAGASSDVAFAAARAGLEKKAEDVMVIDVRGMTTYAEHFVVLSGASDRQVQSIAEGIEFALKELGERPIGVEGYGNGTWVLLDYGDVVIHVFHQDTRQDYDLEGLWADAPRTRLTDGPAR